MDLLHLIFEAGVVGAGGAGFPTHKKLTSDANLLIVNAAECEPLLASDRYVMRHYANEIVSALTAIKREFNIPRIVIGTKSKYTEEIASLKNAFVSSGEEFEIFGVDSFYPAGDEQILIYEITGQTVPPGGIPLALGIVVINVTTALNIFEAMQGLPVLSKFVTVTGEVETPKIIKVPVGTSINDCIKAAGGASLPRYAVIKGGPMMGQIYSFEESQNLYIGKADGGFIVLPEDHPRIEFSKKPLNHVVNLAKSLCIQCSYCTEMCPRYLIGHKMRPHKVMRSVATDTNAQDLTDALLCCECGICELFACPMGLSPRAMNIHVKGLLREQGKKLEDRTIYSDNADSREYRRISQQRIINRLDISKYPTHIYEMTEFTPDSVTIPLKHGVGRPSEPTVKVGDSVNVGDIIAKVAFEDVGCVIHSSIDGVINAIDNSIVIKRREEEAQ